MQALDSMLPVNVHASYTAASPHRPPGVNRCYFQSLTATTQSERPAVRADVAGRESTVKVTRAS